MTKFVDRETEFDETSANLYFIKEYAHILREHFAVRKRLAMQR